MVALFLLLLALVATCSVVHAFKKGASTTNTALKQRSYMSSTSINDWMIEQGTKKNEIKVELSGTGRTVASSDLKKGELIISIPLGLALDFAKAKTYFGASVDASKLRTGDIGMIALLLLVEKNLGEASKYSPYIKLLPETVQGVLSWNESEISEFAKSTTRKVMSQINSIASDFKYLEQVKSPLLPPLTEEAFRWAVGTVKSRYMFIDGEPMLLPGLDFIAMDPFAVNEPFSTGAGVFGGKVVKVNADRAFKKGDSMSISYGVKNSAESIEDHGVIADIDTVDSSCELSVSVDLEADKYPNDKVNILEDNGWRRTMQFDLEADSSVDFDPDLIKFLRLKLLVGKDSFILEPCFMNTVFQTLNSEFSKENEQLVMQYLATTCQGLLEGLNAVASEADDAALVAANAKPKGGGGVVDAANKSVVLATLRMQERAALSCAIEKARSELGVINSGVLDTREFYQERRLRELDLLRPLDEYEINSF